MGEIKFGRKQINNPTPASINFWLKVVNLVCGASVGWLATSGRSIFHPHTLDIINGIVGLLLIITNVLAPMFGVQVQTKDVPVEDVTVIENK